MIRLPRSLRFKKEFFIFLLPLFFIIHGFLRYPESIGILDVAVLFLKYVVFTLFFSIVLSFVFKSLRKAFLFTFMVLSLNLFFGSIHDWMKVSFGQAFITRYVFLIPLILILLVSSAYYFKKTTRQFTRLIQYLNFLLIILILTDLIWFANKALREEKKLLASTPCTNCPDPDIFLLITDGYGGKGQLANRFKFDNTGFEHMLAIKGFYVIDSSISNYSATNKSMASLFNMQYLSDSGKEDYHSYTNPNALVEFLTGQGYEVKNLSFFRVADQFPYVSIEYFPTGTSLITNHTLLARLNRDIRHNLASTLGIEAEKKRIQEIIEKAREYQIKRDEKVMQGLLEEAAQKKSTPRFIYAHFTMPHAPFLFDSKGNPLSTELSEELQYIEYLQFTNSKLSYAVQRILSLNPSAVVFLLSDHGYRKDSQLPLSPDRFLNLNAIYFPDQDYRSFYKGMSNVNHFRIVLNKLFKQKFPLLKDSTVY